MEQLFGTGAWHHPPSPVGCGKELNPPLNFTRMEGHQKKEKDLSGGTPLEIKARPKATALSWVRLTLYIPICFFNIH
eukprot:scaffold51138_cov21-Tisochrysis_lutea.AAC.2